MTERGHTERRCKTERGTPEQRFQTVFLYYHMKHFRVPGFTCGLQFAAALCEFVSEWTILFPISNLTQGHFSANGRFIDYGILHTETLKLPRSLQAERFV